MIELNLEAKKNNPFYEHLGVNITMLFDRLVVFGSKAYLPSQENSGSIDIVGTHKGCPKSKVQEMLHAGGWERENVGSMHTFLYEGWKRGNVKLVLARNYECILDIENATRICKIFGNTITKEDAKQVYQVIMGDQVPGQDPHPLDEFLDEAPPPPTGTGEITWTFVGNTAAVQNGG